MWDLTIHPFRGPTSSLAHHSVSGSDVIFTTYLGELFKKFLFLFHYVGHGYVEKTSVGSCLLYFLKSHGSYVLHLVFDSVVITHQLRRSMG